MNEVLSRESIPKPTNTDFTLEGETFSFETYNVGKTRDLPNPGLMPTGQWQDVMKIWEIREAPPLINAGTRRVTVPYTNLLPPIFGIKHGDYSTNAGMEEYKNADLRLTDQSFSPQDWAAELWRFAKLKNPRTFAKDETLACLRGVEVKKDGTLRFVVGPGLYSDAFYSMGSEGVVTGLSAEERQKLAGNAELQELNEKLIRTYGEGKSLREIIAEKAGHLPEFSENVYNHLIGVAGTVLTNDGKFVFVRRGKNVSVNQGINVTASGGVPFNKEALSRLGIQGHLAGAMALEANEEIGLKSGELIQGAMQERIKLELGLSNTEYDLVQVAFERELPRGGSPEAMFLILFKGNTDQLVRKIVQNDHPDRAEIDELVYAMPAKRVKELIETPGAESVIQHKAISNLTFALSFMDTHPWNA